MRAPANATIVASMGRAGSGMVYRAILAARNETFQPKQKTKFLRSLAHRPNWDHAVLKSHDYPQNIPLPEECRALFCFGDVVDTISSLVRMIPEKDGQFFQNHHHNMYGIGDRFDVASQDVFRIEDQLREWTGTKSIETLCVRYDALWSNVGEISDFLGYKIKLPQRVPRIATNIEPEILAEIKQTYAPMNEFQKSLPDIFVSGEF